MKAFISFFISLVFLLFVGAQTLSASPRQDDDGPRIENVVYVEHVMLCVTVAAPFVVIPEAPTLVRATPYLSAQIAAWYAERHTKPSNRHGITATIYFYCKRSSNAPHGKPPYADITCRAS